MNKIVLVKSKINWADEMNLGGFALFSENEWKRHLLLVKKCYSYNEFDGRNGLGSNQELYFNNLSVYKKQFKVSKLSEKESQQMMTYFNLKLNDGLDKKAWEFSSFGVFTSFNNDTLLDFLHQMDNGKIWLKKNGYKIFE